MKMKTIANRSENDIVDYRIEEAQIDQDGKVMRDEHGNYLKTGRTLRWTIKAKEEKEFPAYVADYLLGIYGQKDPDAKNQLLVEVGESEKKVEKVDKLTCQYCGKKFTSLKGKGLHFAAKHPEKL